MKTSASPMTTSTIWVRRSAIANTRLSRADSSVPLMLSSGQHRDEGDAEDDVTRSVPSGSKNTER